MAQQKIVQTAGHQQLGEFAPEFARLNDDAKAEFARSMIFPIGEPNTAYAKYFIGNSYLAPISKEQIPFVNVTFEPGCRNNWHIHKSTSGGGQMLVGVAADSWFAHLAFEIPGENTENVWLEPVTDEAYATLSR